MEVIGVVADSKYRRLTEQTLPSVFLPMAQDFFNRATLVVRAARPEAVVRAAVREMDGQVPLYGIRSLEEQRMRSLSTPRMAATLLGMLGGLGLLLGTLGL